ncbi:MAG: PfkB family carbohydrate kinase [bacterium]
MDDDRFKELIGRFGSKTVCVIGDFILDEYLIGDTRRVSREAPVVVIDYRSSAYHPGGAANAVQNVASMGAACRAIGVVGEDAHGKILRGLLDARGADTSGLLPAGEVETAVKTRILAGELHAQKQQVARIDRSYRLDTRADVHDVLGSAVAEGVTGSDAVLISDYGMGVVPGPVSALAIEASRERGVPVVVDSRFQMLGYSGATVATPNEVERRGMVVYGAGGSVERIGIVGTRDITDVTGAGDTVAAIVSLALASGATLAESAEVATYAASVVVMKRGTATITPEELTAVRAKHPRPAVVETEP